MHDNVIQPAMYFSGSSWGDVFREIAEWSDTHARSRSLPAAEPQPDTWVLLEGVLLDRVDDLNEGDEKKYAATLLYG